MLHIQNTREVMQPWIHCLFYGDSGSGKTTLASTFPDPLFVVPARERSELTLAGQDIPFVRVGIDENEKPLPPMKHMLTVLREIEKRHAAMGAAVIAGDEAAAAAHFPWQTLVFESLSHYVSDIQIEISGGRQMDQQGWGKLYDHMRELHMRLRALQCHVVFTSLAKVDGEGTAATGGPSLSGQTGKLLPSACDIVGYCVALERSNQDTNYQLYLKQHRVFPARSRFKTMPKYWENPSFAQFAPYIPGLTPG
jgi:hypothetical protein